MLQFGVRRIQPLAIKIEFTAILVFNNVSFYLATVEIILVFAFTAFEQVGTWTAIKCINIISCTIVLFITVSYQNIAAGTAFQMIASLTSLQNIITTSAVEVILFIFSDKFRASFSGKRYQFIVFVFRNVLRKARLVLACYKFYRNTIFFI